MKRQRSRNRGGGSGGKPQQNANRAFESNGPDGVKIRGAAQHVFEKYQQLARDALTAGDRVLGESYQQHAEHYFRVLRAVQPNRPASDIIGRDAFASGFDIDFEDESGEQADTQTEALEAEAERADSREWRQDRNENRQQRDDRPPRDRNFNRDDRPREERPREDRPRDDRPFNRDDRQPRDRNFNRDDRPRDDRPRDERPREDRPREDRPPREERSRDDRARNETRVDRNDREPRADPLAVVEPRATPLTVEAEPKSSPVLRSHDGGVSQAPAFLQQAQPRAEPAAESGEAAPKSRRRRAPRAGADSSADGTSSSIVSSEDA